MYQFMEDNGMKKGVVLVIAISMLIPMAAIAVDVEWSGSYELQGFRLGEDIVDFAESDGDTQGFYQSLIIEPTFDLGRDVKVHTGIRLYGDYWSGDHRKPGGGGITEWGEVEGSALAEKMDLDYGYAEMPFLGGKLSVGRQKANWGHGLTTADDRRDRIAYQYDLDKALGGPLSLLALYDLRQDVDINEVNTNGHLVSAAAVGYHMQSKILWGLLGGYFLGDANKPLTEDPFLLDSIALVGPFMEGPVGPIDLKFAAHTLFPINNDRDTFGDYNEDGLIGGYAATYGPFASGESGGFYNTFNFAVMLRPILDLSEITDLMPQQLVVEAQGLFVYNGSLVDPGFDSFSSMIGNAGRNTVNPSNVFDMGGFGYEDDHQILASARVNYEITPGLNAILAGGMYHFFEYKRNVGVPNNEEVVRAEITNYFADVKLTYAITEEASLFANYGWLGDDTSMIADPTAPGEGDPKQQFSAGVEVKF